jgi:hypothetical protein
MKRVNLLAIIAISFCLAATVTSCTSETSAGTDASIATTASDESQAATISDGVIAEADQYLSTAASSGYMAVKSAEDSVTVPIVTVTPKDSVSFPKTVTIDFGTAGFTGKRGNVLKGKLIVVISDRMWKANSSKTITFDNFYVNGNKVAGSKVVTYKGLNASKNPYSTIVVKDTITRTDGTVVIWNSVRTRERIDNGGTIGDASDDKFSITGGSNGINAKGVAYTMVISANNPLIAFNSYPHFVQGSVTISTEKRTVLVDYGTGTKDDQATITINGVTKNITLKK